MEVDSHFIKNTLIDLVRINSINPSLENNAQGERPIAEYISQQLRTLGWDTKAHTIRDHRLNVVGIRKGKGSGKSLMINAHTDTVGISGMDNPFAAKVEQGRLMGRGAYDMKGSIAAMLGVAKALTDLNETFQGDLILTFVADEEYESIGTEFLLHDYTADACIVTEPTDLRVCLGHRGFAVYEISTFGKTAHGGLHKEGIDANLKMGKVLSQLDHLSNDLSHRSHHLFGEASLHVPLIKGGQSLFIYSNQCRINVERRTLPGESRETTRNELQKMLDTIREDDTSFRSELKELIWRNPYQIERDATIVGCLSDSLNKPAEYIGHTWWEDSGLFGQAGIETVIFGPKGGGIHQVEEWVDLESVYELSGILLATARSYCNKT